MKEEGLVAVEGLQWCYWGAIGELQESSGVTRGIFTEEAGVPDVQHCATQIVILVETWTSELKLGRPNLGLDLMLLRSMGLELDSDAYEPVKA